MMKHKKFIPAKDMEWIQPQQKGYLMACCDCGLVHGMDFRIVANPKNKKKQKVQFRAWRAPKYTAMLRKKNGTKVYL